MKKELVILVADKNMEATIKGLLLRWHSFNIREIKQDMFDIFIHPRRDPGIFHEASDFLKQFIFDYEYSLVLLDREGSGQENKNVNEIADQIRINLERNGWKGRTEVIVLEPELEIWAWTNSPHLANVTGFDNLSEVKRYLEQLGLLFNDQQKPDRPKEAFEALLREKRIPRSSSIYFNLARLASFKNCSDPSFLKFKQTLMKWFPRGDEN